MNPLSHLEPTLESGLAALGISRPGLAARLLDYLALLERWNRTYNLTAIRDPGQMVSLHLLDSLSIAGYAQGRIADLGSGAGLPGIPLALHNPALEIALVESAGKKARFLRHVVRELGLERVTVHACRAQQVPAEPPFDRIVARALAPLAGILAAGGHLLGPGGCLLAMKGRIPEEELDALPPGWRHRGTHRLHVPGLAAERHLIIVEKL